MQQATYIQQLQEQHFEEYMAHTYRLLRLHQWQQFRQQHDASAPPAGHSQLPVLPSEKSEVLEYKSETDSADTAEVASNSDPQQPVAVAASPTAGPVVPAGLTGADAAAAAIEQLDINTDEGLAKVDSVLSE